MREGGFALPSDLLAAWPISLMGSALTRDIKAAEGRQIEEGKDRRAEQSRGRNHKRIVHTSNLPFTMIGVEEEDFAGLNKLTFTTLIIQHTHA